MENVSLNLQLFQDYLSKYNILHQIMANYNEAKWSSWKKASSCCRNRIDHQIFP